MHMHQTRINKKSPGAAVGRMGFVQSMENLQIQEKKQLHNLIFFSSVLLLTGPPKQIHSVWKEQRSIANLTDS